MTPKLSLASKCTCTHVHLNKHPKGLFFKNWRLIRWLKSETYLLYKPDWLSEFDPCSQHWLEGENPLREGVHYLLFMYHGKYAHPHIMHLCLHAQSGTQTYTHKWKEKDQFCSSLIVIVEHVPGHRFSPWYNYQIKKNKTKKPKPSGNGNSDMCLGPASLGLHSKTQETKKKK